MPWGEIGAVLAVIVIIFIIGNVWFSIVERILGCLKRLFGSKEPGAWHTLAPDREEEEKQHV